MNAHKDLTLNSSFHLEDRNSKRRLLFYFGYLKEDMKHGDTTVKTCLNHA